MAKVVGGSLPASIWKSYMTEAHRRIAVHPLPGVYNYDGSEEDPYAEGRGEDEPWVERGGDGYRPGREDDKGVIEDLIDSLFGDDEEKMSAPPPPPPPSYRPRAENDLEDVPAEEDVAPEEPTGPVTPPDGEAVLEPAF
jgi:membrane peptidoglycan carboxypeptidase